MVVIKRVIPLTLATASSLNATTGNIPLPPKGTLTAINAIISNTGFGPVWVHLTVTGAEEIAQGWIRGDGNYSWSDGIAWDGNIQLSDTNPNSLSIYARNDTGSTVNLSFAWTVVM